MLRISYLNLRFDTIEKHSLLEARFWRGNIAKFLYFRVQFFERSIRNDGGRVYAADFWDFGNFHPRAASAEALGVGECDGFFQLGNSDEGDVDASRGHAFSLPVEALL